MHYPVGLSVIPHSNSPFCRPPRSPDKINHSRRLEENEQVRTRLASTSPCCGQTCSSVSAERRSALKEGGKKSTLSTEVRMRLKDKIAIVVGAGQSPGEGLGQWPRHGSAFRSGRRKGTGRRQ